MTLAWDFGRIAAVSGLLIGLMVIVPSAAQAGTFAVLAPGDPATKISDDLYAFALDATAAGAAGSMVLLKSANQLKVQRLDGLGKPVGTPIEIAPATGFSYGGALTTLTGGRIAVVYDYTPGTLAEMGVYMRLLNPDGSFVAAGKISTIAANLQRYPSVAAMANGNFAVAWVDDRRSSSGANNRVRGRVLSPTGALVGAEIAVSNNALDARMPTLAAVTNGFAASFVAGGKILLQRFTFAGSPVGTASQIDVADGRVHEDPKAAGLPGGGVAVLWESNVYTTVTNLHVIADTTLKGAFLSQTGGVLERFEINDTGVLGGKIESRADINAFGSGVLVGWSIAGGTTDYFNATSIGPEVRAVEVSTGGAKGRFMTISSTSNLDQSLGGLTILPSGKPLVVYSDRGHPPSAGPLGLFATFLAPPSINRTPIGGSSGSDPNLRGTAQNDTIRGLGGEDRLFGLGGSDVLEGGDGGDRLDGGSGRDVMRGGPGNDLYLADDPLDRIEELAGQGTDTVNATVSFGLPSNVESLTLIGSRAATGAGNALSNILTGNDLVNNLYGGAGNDVLIGGLGNDYVNGGPGADRMKGGAGSDIYYVDSTSDQITELADGGSETVYSEVSFTLAAQAETLRLLGSGPINGTGNSGANWIYGNTNANTIIGGSENDQLDGGAGPDTIDGGPGRDVIYGELGNDTLTGGGARDLFFFRLQFGNDTITDFTLSEDDVVSVPMSYFPTRSDVLNAASQSGANVVINAPSGDRITLQGVNLGDLTVDNFNVN